MIDKETAKKQYLDSIPSIVKEAMEDLSKKIDTFTKRGESRLKTSYKDELVAKTIVKELNKLGYKATCGEFNDWTGSYFITIEWK